jgi:hypothetical protein
MKETLTRPANQEEDSNDALKTWTMIVSAMIFIVLYGAALLGWLSSVTDERMATHLEPIIFVIMGYYFGRLPARHNEKTLKGEINRQTQKADAAQHAKEQTMQAREALEEKVKNVRVTLARSTATASSATGIAAKSATDNPDRPGGAAKDEALRQAVAAALNILDS